MSSIRILCGATAKASNTIASGTRMCPVLLCVVQRKDEDSRFTPDTLIHSTLLPWFVPYTRRRSSQAICHRLIMYYRLLDESVKVKVV